MKIAFASSNGLSVDRHFGLAEAFYLWEVGRTKAECIDKIGVAPDSADREDKILARAQMLDGCTMVYSLEIGGPAAAKLVARHIHPMKTATAVRIVDLVKKLQVALRGRPPPWLAKAMGEKPIPIPRAALDDE